MLKKIITLIIVSLFLSILLFVFLSMSSHVKSITLKDGEMNKIPGGFSRDFFYQLEDTKLLALQMGGFESFPGTELEWKILRGNEIIASGLQLKSQSYIKGKINLFSGKRLNLRRGDVISIYSQKPEDLKLSYYLRLTVPKW